MQKFEVWAPLARSVAVQLGDNSHGLEASGRGWWKGELQDAGPGSDYSFLIDDGNAVPDPRSQYQPCGVHGPSRLIDHSAFPWSDDKWQPKPLSSAIIYELHIGTFTPEGTFRAAIERLDYLVSLGITHVELMPVNEFSGRWGWGYDGVDLYSPHQAYGAPDDLKALVNACHTRGLAVLLDVVYNHFGPVGNYLDQFGPYLTKAYGTPWGAAVNLDHAGSHEVRKFFADNARMWLSDYHFDGLRLDAVHAFVDKSAIHFLEYLAIEVEALAAQLGRILVLIAESDLNDTRLVSSREAGGYGLDAQWSDDFHHALHTVLTGERNGYYEDFGSLEQLAKALQHVFVYDGTYSPHRNRLHGRLVKGLSGHRFITFAQNHDQVGNRARGERLSQLVSVGKQKIAAALVLTSPFVPMLFQGEEFGASTPFQYFSQHEDREIAASVSDGRKTEFQAFGWEPEEIPDPQDPETFEKSKLNWDEIAQEPHAALLRWYKELIALRRSHPALTDGRLDRIDVRFEERAKWFVVRRGDLEVACNFAADRQAVPITGKPVDVLCSDDYSLLRPSMIELPAESVAILSGEALASVQKHFRQYASG